jgi:hypothetical protein
MISIVLETCGEVPLEISISGKPAVSIESARCCHKNERQKVPSRKRKANRPERRAQLAFSMPPIYTAAPSRQTVQLWSIALHQAIDQNGTRNSFGSWVCQASHHLIHHPEYDSKLRPNRFGATHLKSPDSGTFFALRTAITIEKHIELTACELSNHSQAS